MDFSKIKIVRVRFLLDNGIDQDEHYFKIESHQSDFDKVAVGQFALLSSNLINNVISVGRITGVLTHEKNIKSVFKKFGSGEEIPRVMKAGEAPPVFVLDYLESMEVLV